MSSANDAWAELLIKYDARHFMGNWFLMAQVTLLALTPEPNPTPSRL